MKQSSTMDHDQRVSVLSTIASLSGCTKRLKRLPDGHIPDVLQIDTVSNMLFIGDAKHTETPGNLDTRLRLLPYLRWIVLHVNRAKDAVAVFALCFGTARHRSAWKDTVLCLCREAGFDSVSIHEMSLGSRIYILWFAVVSNSAARREIDARIHSRASSTSSLARIRAGLS